jgi:tRNA 5-methylaminomethyl-2-thiouridine biosynthesis bifunctional protein
MLTPARLAYDALGTPWSAQFQDVYHSADGGLAQCRHVFLEGNGLPERWRGRHSFVILETGFGFGLNFLAAWQAWREDAQRCARLHFVSVEKHPFSAADLAVLHARWPELAPLAERLRAAWPPLVSGLHRLHFEEEGLILTLALGDIGKLLPRLLLAADAIFLDGFAPDRNPEMWAPSVARRLARLAAPGATLATWTVAGAVREALADAGFALARRPGFGRKREMLAGTLPPTATCRSMPSPIAPERRAAIIGAGLAGCAAAERLAARGWDIVVIERHTRPAAEASGNHAGVMLPLVSRDDNIASRLSRACYLHGLRHLQALERETSALSWQACGVLQLARDAVHEKRQREAVSALGLPPEFVRFLAADEAAERAGGRVGTGGWWFPASGWVNPPSLCAAQLSRHAERINARFGREAKALEHDGDRWSVRDAEGVELARAPVLVLANAIDALRLAPACVLPLRRVRGQVSHVPAELLPPVGTVLCREGYLSPPWHRLCALGASFDFDDDDPEPRLSGHVGNLARLERLLPGASARIEPASLAGRVGFRTVSPDRLPLAGGLPDPTACAERPLASLADVPRHPGLTALLGYGARGLVWAQLAAELMAAELEGEPVPLEADLVAAADPARFLLRARRRGHARGPQRGGASAVPDSR